MLTEFPMLFVSWRSTRTRRIYPVGRLEFDAITTSYRFCYINSVNQAVEGGFTPLLEFPRLDAVYRAKQIFPLFANRLMPPGRPGYASFLTNLGLDLGDAHPLAILARTGGRRETDQIELFPVPSRDDSGCYTTHCLLRVLRYRPQPATEERIARLLPDEKLFVMPDPQNPTDPNSLAVRTNDNFLLGYLPAYLTSDLWTLPEKCPATEVRVSRVNLPPAEGHHRLLCRLVSRWPDGFQPFADGSFQPINPVEAQLQPV